LVLSWFPTVRFATKPPLLVLFSASGGSQVILWRLPQVQFATKILVREKMRSGCKEV
jgi:hypothetical protein